MVLYSEDEHTYECPLSYICLAHNMRFPSPYSQHVISSDVIDRSFVQTGPPTDPRTVIRTTRLVLKRGKVPSWAPPMIQKIGTSWVLEESDVDLEPDRPDEREMRTSSRNLDHKTIMEVCEWQTYKVHEADSSKTQSLTLSRVTSDFGFWPLQSRIEKFGLSRIPKAVDKSRAGIDLVASLLMNPSTSCKILSSGPLRPYPFDPVPSPLALAVRAKFDEARAAVLRREEDDKRAARVTSKERRSFLVGGSGDHDGSGGGTGTGGDDELAEPGRIWRERWRAATKRGVTRFKERVCALTGFLCETKES